MAAYRVIAGPSQPDRVIALEVIGTNVVGLILVLGIRSGSHIYVDAALVIALLSFLGTVSLAKYLAGGTVIDRGNR
jgi:multisubunit Na+/H+ antiporter MnhF subunit